MELINRRKEEEKNEKKREKGRWIRGRKKSVQRKRGKEK